MKSFANDKLFDNRNYSSIPISPHRNFHESLVNLDNSAVHIPINVYEVTRKLVLQHSSQLTIAPHRKHQISSMIFCGRRI